MFNFKLYKEGLRKSLFIAALFIAIMKLGAVLIPISNITANVRAIEYGWGHGRLVIEGLGGNIALVLAMAAFAPFITLYLFSFLNKRSSSDFYHSLPHKRETIFVSYTAAILTWVIGGIWLSTGISLAIYAVGAEHVLLNLSSVIFTTLGLTAGCLLVIGAVLMAMGVTGTAFSNIVTALLIVFLPRMIMTAFTDMIVSTTQIVNSASFGIFGNSAYHIPFHFLVNNMLGMHAGRIEQTFIHGALYTAVLGLIYLVIALFLFKRRRSETAGNPAQSGVLHAMIRIAVAFTVCLMPLSMLFMSSRGFGWADALGILALYAIAVIAYFAYELITTRKISNIVRALPGLGILVLLNIAFLLGLNAGEAAILNRTLEVSNIAAVRVESLGDDHSMWWDGSVPYEMRRAQEIEIADEALSGLLLDALARNIATIRDPHDDLWRQPTLQASIAFVQTSGGSVQRRIRLTLTEHEQVLQLLDQHREYADLFLNLPEHPEEVVIWQISDEAALEVYELLREEVRSLDLATWRGMQAHSFQGGVMHYAAVEVRGFIGRDVYRNTYSITGATPRALDRFLYHVNAENFAGVEAGFVYGLSYGRIDSLIVHGFGEWEHIHFNRWDIDMQQSATAELIEALLDAIRTQGNTPVDRSLPHLSVQISHWTPDGELVGGTLFFNADEDLIDLLPDMGFHVWH